MYDVILIGAGPGGYVAAERLGQGKKKVLLIEEHHVGGVCLNMGCIPTKTLLNSAKQYVHALEAHKYGVTAGGVSYDWSAIQKWKNDVVEKIRSGVAAQLKRFGVDVVQGRGEIIAAPSGTQPGKVKVNSGTGETMYETQAILVSTGSIPAIPPIPGVKDNPRVVDSTKLLSIQEVPKRLAVIGGGVIGVEFAGLFSSLGSEVTVIEMMDEIVPFMDREQAPLLRRAMRKVDFKLGCKVEKIEAGTVYYSGKDGKPEHVEVDLILVAVGRQPVLDTWGAKALGIEIDSKGVKTDDRMRTTIPGIWAAGDVTGKSLLAHSAYRMADVAVIDITDHLDGTKTESKGMRYHAIPWAVYGLTEAAGVGITEQEAAAKGIAILKASLPMRLSGRFVAENTFAGQGTVKVIADVSTRKILGIHSVGAYSSEFIWGGSVIIEQELRIEDVKGIIFPHPSVCELIRDAVWELGA